MAYWFILLRSPRLFARWLRVGPGRRHGCGPHQRPAKFGLRFSIKARRPSLKSSDAKQSATIETQRSRSRSVGSASTCVEMNFIAATVSGAFAAIELA